MGNRTSELPELTGLAHIIREMRYHEFSRQFIGILLIAVYSYWAAPVESLFWPGAVIALIGILFRLYASGFVIKNKELATSGPYALVRHPLYTGNILMFAGYSLANGQLWPWLVTAFFLWFWYPPAIEYEDRKLNKIFGERWQEWSRRTPALIPRSVAGVGDQDSSWSFAKSLKQNIEPGVVVYSLFWLWWLWQQLPALPGSG
ncbi:MAG: isoprenylcysteine carboxylmethyltransferase family protein [Gammaproteobacteria bacterium]|jgi:protein-S-isoprenylcysteine O-methyltransferase Ste14|nr:isoprenylcysteine carboxylmethyltransferase family protein [Gammaproteobacteria bacterium]MDP7271824.1 isoprenylcysteine carboxylmethyltransferase family protein [Gammaproteobacteria bacterium]HJP05389.1 isoprenylcysteine carboxylmethyltransferase family protein [Gammaproteobacteria bacterium]